MSEEEKIQETSDNRQQNKPEMNKESSIVNEELQTINHKLQTEEMEVHHHPQMEHKHKPWKEYLLEGLMIFVAVTLGFFAESLREHLGEKSKEHEYIASLKKDLATDTANLSIWILAFNDRINEYDTVINILRHPDNIADGGEIYYKGRMVTRGTVFDDNNNTIVQLNISGNFRLISNKTIAKKIVAYENDIENYKNVNGYDAYEARALYGPQAKIFDAFIFNDMSKPISDSSVTINNSLVGGFRNVFVKPSGNPKLLNADKEKINEFVYYLHQRRSTFAAEILILYKQKKDAAELLKDIDKEYGMGE